MINAAIQSVSLSSLLHVSIQPLRIVGGGLVSDSAIRPLFVVKLTPLLVQHLGLSSIPVQLPVQQFIPQLAIEAFHTNRFYQRLPGVMESGPMD